MLRFLSDWDGFFLELVNNYFTGTATRIEGLSLEMLEEETVRRHRQAYDPTFYPWVGLEPRNALLQKER